VHAHGVADDVLFTGMLLGGERLAALAEAELFALPSRQENFAVSVAEAMGASCPVLVSDQVNICDDIREAAAGAVLPLEIAAWTAALSRWLANPSLRRATGRRGARFARAHYDWPQIAAGWCDQYDQLLNARRRARQRPFQLVPQFSL
jgi:glycosyltransferase involved in cell wall biosynthesis